MLYLENIQGDSVKLWGSILLQLSWRYEYKIMWSVFLKEGQNESGNLLKRIILIVCAVKQKQKVFVFTVK